MFEFVRSYRESILIVNVLGAFEADEKLGSLNSIEHHDAWMFFVRHAEEQLRKRIADHTESCGINPDGCIWFRIESEDVQRQELQASITLKRELRRTHNKFLKGS